MRIAITGASGQLGKALQAQFSSDHTIIALGHDDFELGHPECVARLVATSADLVIHPAAYTNVDGCARDPELAYRVNGLGTQYVALACRERRKGPGQAVVRVRQVGESQIVRRPARAPAEN